MCRCTVKRRLRFFDTNPRQVLLDKFSYGVVHLPSIEDLLVRPQLLRDTIGESGLMLHDGTLLLLASFRGSEARGFELEVLRVSASKLLHSLALGQIDARALFRTISLPEYWARHSTHIVMFPQGVVGIEYSWLGPKPVQLFSFFNGLAKGHSDVVAFRQVVTGPRQSDLRSLVDIRSIEIRASYVAIQKVWEWLKEICEKTPWTSCDPMYCPSEGWYGV